MKPHGYGVFMPLNKCPGQGILGQSFNRKRFIMHTRYAKGGGALIAALLTGSTAFAQVSPRDVWDGWREYMEGFGYEIAASETVSGGTITIDNLTASMALPEEAGRMEMSLGQMQFVDNGDGSVAIVMPDSLPMTFRVIPPPGEGKTVAFSILYNAPGLEMTATGSPGDLAISLAGAEILMELQSITVDGEVADNIKAKAGLSDVTGNLGFRAGEVRVFSEAINAGSMSYSFAISDPDPEGNGFFTLNGGMEKLTALVTMAMPSVYDPTDMNAALRDGLAFDIAFSTGGGNTEFAFRDGEQEASGTSSSGGAEFKFALDRNEMAYGFGIDAWEAFMAGSDIPLPIRFAVARIGMEFAMPIAKTDIPKDFSARVDLLDFAPDAMIWSMLDPMNGLPRDPATFVMALSGKGNWLFDLLDPEQAMAAAAADIPFEIQSLSLDELRVNAAGAALTGLGSFVFNNDDLATFDGLPAPDGSIDLKLVGANALIDRLIGMGMMSEDDAMGARMMLGLFGRPGEGEDEVLSTIEVRSNGQIFANGQRIQ